MSTEASVGRIRQVHRFIDSHRSDYSVQQLSKAASRNERQGAGYLRSPARALPVESGESLLQTYGLTVAHPQFIAAACPVHRLLVQTVQ
jgi:hypothetical protein